MKDNTTTITLIIGDENGDLANDLERLIDEIDTEEE